MNVQMFLKKNSSTILTFLGAAGVVATTVTAIQATPKAIEIIKADSRENHDGDPYAYTKIEAIKSGWKCYIPTIVIGLSTITCICGANVTNKRTQASLVSAYSLLDSSFKEYKAHVEELYGEDSREKIQEAIAKDKYSELKPIILEDQKLFYDMYAGRYFESSLAEVYRAEYEINRAYAKYGYASLNELYDILGVPRIACGDDVGWSVEASEMFYGYSCIDFEHELVLLEDGLECYVLIMPYPPTADYIC